jgi:hypothetical protein
MLVLLVASSYCSYAVGMLVHHHGAFDCSLVRLSVADTCWALSFLLSVDQSSVECADVALLIDASGFNNGKNRCSSCTY